MPFTKMDTVYDEGTVGRPIFAWAGKNESLMDEASYDQLCDLAQMPFLEGHIAVMPDVHVGKGSTIGSVFITKDAIIPSAVGVDLGCGMQAAKLNLKIGSVSNLEARLATIRHCIEEAVPHGRSDNGGLEDVGAWNPGNIPPWIHVHFDDYLYEGFNEVMKANPKINRSGDLYQRAKRQLGTLGTGNHFIELSVDQDDDVWLVIHSGSRGVGAAIGGYFARLALQKNKHWFVKLPNDDLAYLVRGEQEFADYLKAVNWAQHYAHVNRVMMMNAVVRAVGTVLHDHDFHRVRTIDCHHNYVAQEKHLKKDVLVTRKGAVRATKDAWGIIPGAMGRKSFIVTGKGHTLSYHSCSHGAGRAMSRNEARKHFSVEDHIQATAGLECHKGEEVIDETPAAYKPVEKVMEAQSDLVEIQHTLEALVCVKGL